MVRLHENEKSEKVTGARRKQLRRCESKKAYRSLSEANKYIASVEKKHYSPDKKGNRRPLRAYLCKVCFKIHVGHIPMDEWHRMRKGIIETRITECLR